MVDFVPIPGDAGVGINTGTGREETARVLKAQFGQNYAQRAGDGLNSIDSEQSFMIDNLTRVESKVITDFFRAKGGWQAFYFTVPGEGSPRLWTCEKWSVTHVTHLHDSVSATFKQVFTP